MRWWCTLVLLCCASVARAEPFALATLDDEHTLTPFVSWYRDEAGSSLDQVRAAYAAGEFTREQNPVTQFGFTTTVHWLAFEVVGDTPWVLRLSYPLIDDLTLYRVRADGSVARVETGDLRPFAARARPSFDFTFVEHGGAQYFLRAQTSGALRLPVSAWRADALAASERRDERIALAFLGAIAALALYNLGVYWLTKQLEHLILVAVQVTELGSLASFGGLLAPVFPDHPALANRVLPVSLAGCLLFGCLFSVVVLGRFVELQRETVWVRRLVVPACLLNLFTLVAPLSAALRAAVLAFAIVALGGSYLLIKLHKSGLQAVQLHERGWVCLVAGLGAQVVLSRVFAPGNFFGEWGSHLGCLTQGIVLSLALAQQLNLIKQRLASNVAELEQALTRAEQATRVKDEFVATMSHELRTPLNAIINVPLALLEKFEVSPGAECAACGDRFALDDGERLDAAQPCPSCGEPRLSAHPVTQFVGDPAQAQHYLALAERCGKHLLQMVNGVLDYSKIAAGKFELQLAPTDPLRLLREASESMQEAAAEKGVALRLELPEETPALATLDELRIRQVLFNLLSNAIKFSPTGSAITLGAQEREHELEITVSDRGIGIAREHQARIFDGFEQVHRGDNRKYGGSGLGLSISRSLVRMHGGELSVESELGHGSTFRIRLPRDPSLRAANDNLAVA